LESPTVVTLFTTVFTLLYPVLSVQSNPIRPSRVFYTGQSGKNKKWGSGSRSVHGNHDLDFQSSAAAWKHADLMVYNALVFAHYHVPVHSIVLLLRPEAAHSNMNGVIDYAPRPGRGSMNFAYEVVRLWERPAEDLLAADLGARRQMEFQGHNIWR